VASTIWPVASTVPAPVCGPTGAEQGCITFSQPLEADLCVYRGDSGRFRVNVTNPDGTELDISAATWDCDIRATVDAEPPICTLDVVPVDINTVEVILTAENSRLLIVDTAVWDLEMTLGTEVQTLIRGVVNVTRDVSRT
jgi:hypothetical protein